VKAPGPPARGYPPWRKVRHAVNGLLHAMRYDLSVAYKIPVSVIVIVASIVFARWVDLILLVVVTAQALAAELFNSAVERLCDFVENRYDPRIGAIKDIAAAAAGVTILVWAAVVVYEYLKFLLLLLRGI
jgi:diacylglycerol kinase (ATP)